MLFFLLKLTGCSPEKEQKELFSIQEAENKLRLSLKSSPPNLFGYVGPISINRFSGDYRHQSPPSLDDFENADKALLLLAGSVLKEISSNNPAHSQYKAHFERLLTPQQFMSLNGHQHIINERSLQKYILINKKILDFILNGDHNLSDSGAWAKIYQSSDDNHLNVLLRFARDGIGNNSNLNLTHYAEDTWHLRTNVSHQLRHLLVVKDTTTGASYMIKIQPINIAQNEVESFVHFSGVNQASVDIYMPSRADRLSISISKILTRDGAIAPTLSQFIEGGGTLSTKQFNDLDNIFTTSLEGFVRNGKIPTDLFHVNAHNIVVTDESVVFLESELKVTRGRLIYNLQSGEIEGTGDLRIFLDNARQLYQKLGRNLPTTNQDASTHIKTTVSDVGKISINVIDDSGMATNQKVSFEGVQITNPNEIVEVPKNLSARAFTLFTRVMMLVAVGSLAIEIANEIISADERVNLDEKGITLGARPFTNLNDHLATTTNFRDNANAFHTYASETTAIKTAVVRHNSVCDLRQNLKLDEGNREVVLFIKQVPNNDKNQSFSEGLRLPILTSGTTMNDIKLSYLHPVVDLQGNIQLYPIVRDYSNSRKISMNDFNLVDDFLSKIHFEQDDEQSLMVALDDLSQAGVIIGFTVDYQGNLAFFANVDDKLVLRYVAKYSSNFQNIKVVNISDTNLVY